MFVQCPSPSRGCRECKTYAGDIIHSTWLLGPQRAELRQQAKVKRSFGAYETIGKMQGHGHLWTASSLPARK
jgi:hypothetical protein